MLVASFDVGIVNLAMVVARVEGTEVIKVLHLTVNDTTKFEHRRVPAEHCQLGHMKTTTDRVNHFIQERLPLLQRVDRVLIERQPIQGHTDVEQVLFMLFRDKAELVSPNAMHKFFKINHLTYEWRKVKTTEIADASFQHLDIPHYFHLPRRHDIADAWCLLLFWLQTQASESPPRRTQPQCAAAGSTTDSAAPAAIEPTARGDVEDIETEQSRTEALHKFSQSMTRFVYKGSLTQK